MPRNVVLCSVLIACLCLALPALAVDSREWAFSSVEDFLAGEFDGVVLEAPGTLRAGLAHEEVGINAEHVWAVVQDSRGVLYAGTGNEGRVYVIEPDGTESQVIELEGSQVYALAVAADDTVYAATSPSGAVFRLGADGSAEEWYRPEATYVWSLLVGKGGALYAATGDPARVLHITAQNAATVVHESNATHLVSLAQRADGTLLAGTGDDGLLLELPRSGKGDVRVVYDAPLDEIRSILPAGDGTMYFVAVQSQPGAAAPTAGLKLGGLTNEGKNGSEAKEGAQEAQAPTPPSPRAGAAASVLYQVDAQGRVDPLWTGKGQRVYGGVLFDGDVVLGTDQQGTVFRVQPDGLAAVLYRGRQTQVVATGVAPNGQLLLGTAEAASVVRLGPDAPETATYTSAVQDAGTLATYGRVRWQAAAGTRGPAFRVRTGNTREPDDRWTAWSAPTREAQGVEAGAAPGRFFQFRFEWSGRDADVAVTRLHVPFAPQNLPPRVVDISFETKGWLAGDQVNVGAESDAAALGVLLKRYNGGENGGGAAQEAEGHSSTIKISWKALDPNDDALEYTVQFRGVEETLWKDLETELTKAEYEWDTVLVPDGWYEVRVIAGDHPSNAATDAGQADRVSEPVLVDNTGPVITGLRAAGAKGRATITGKAEDGSLPLRRGRYSVDGQPWTWFAPQDGIFDGLREAFTIELVELAAGEHTIAVQVLDAAQNIGSGKRVFTAD